MVASSEKERDQQRTTWSNSETEPAGSDVVRATQEGKENNFDEVELHNGKMNGRNNKVSPSSTDAPKKHKKSVIYWLYKHLGLKHIFIFSLLFVSSLIAGYIFWSTEGPAEIEQMNTKLSSIDDKLSVMAKEIIDGVKTNSTGFTDLSALEKYMQGAYVQLLQAEGNYDGSTFFKAETPDNMMWHYWPAVFYASNIYMTVGYGAIFCYTDLGRFLTVIFGIISIPFSFVVIRDIGQWILVSSTKIYARILISWRKAHGIETDPEEDIKLPIKISLTMLLITWLFVSYCTYLWDEYWGEPGSGISYFGSMYYSFITMTSIGMSDDMPLNTTTSAMLTVWYFLSLPMYKIGLRIGYIAIENGILGTLAVLENKMDRREGKPNKTLKALEAASKTPGGGVQALEEQEQIDEFVNNFTVRSIATFMKSHADAYAGDFGRVRVNKAQLNEE